MILLMEICQNSGILQALLILKTLFKVICILIPIIIIITSSINVFKAITSNKDSSINDSIRTIIVKVIIGIVIFFLPLIFKSVFSLVTNLKTDTGYVECFNNATPSKIEYYKQVEKQKAKEKAEKDAAEAKKVKEEKEKRLKEQQELNDRLNKEKSDNNSNNSNNNSNNSDSSNNTSNYKGVIYIGDSRTVGMYRAVNKGAYSSSISKMSGNNYWFASVGKGYSWFKNTAVSQIKTFVGKDNYKVTIQMGANDLSSSTAASSYVSAISSLAKSYPNSKFIIISVNPIDDKKAKGNYLVRNTDVIRFNNVLKSSINNSNQKNILFCDTYSQIINNFSSSDGLHYYESTYLSIYQSINKC